MLINMVINLSCQNMLFFAMKGLPSGSFPNPGIPRISKFLPSFGVKEKHQVPQARPLGKHRSEYPFTKIATPGGRFYI